MKIVVVGGGAAGFFSAVNIAEKNPKAQVVILEKSNKLLSKVKVSGGGRCNVTNGRSNPAELVKFYPRGGKKLYPVFKSFSTSHMIQWLEAHHVPTKTEEDLRVFPQSNSSQTIIDCLMQSAQKHRIEIITGSSVKKLVKKDSQWTVITDHHEWSADKVIFSSGSSAASLKVLSELSLQQTALAPSLFTFNIKDERLKDLQGLSFSDVTLKVVNTKLEEQGPLLITHWGLSGPAILKLSSWGALDFQSLHYRFEILINFVKEDANEVKQKLTALRQQPKRLVINYPQLEIPKRFWERLCDCCGIAPDQTCGELSKKQINKLTEELTQGRYLVDGKSTFKEEFVTCGGIDLSEINLKTFECNKYPGLYLAGEVLNIDALTGGFNFQACWSAGWLISEDLK